MKKSIYNTYLKFTENSHVIYNALTDSTIILKSELTDIESISKYLRNKLIEGGFIVEDSVDEREIFIRKAKEIETQNESYQLIINPTLNCNFNCWYCYESHIPSQMGKETMAHVYRFIDNIYSHESSLTISFFGGEPLLYFDTVMYPILCYANEQAKSRGKKFNANMTSNGYLLSDERISTLMELGFTGGQITLDGDKDTHNSTRFRFKGDDTYLVIISNIIKMLKAGMNITLRINCTENNLDSVQKIPASFNVLSAEEKKRLRVDLQIVWQEKNHASLFETMDNVVKVFKNENLPTAKMDFRNFCYGDVRNSCVINYNGDLYKCTAVDFAKTKRDGYLSDQGELIWENDSLERRMASKFQNQHCKTCRIFPLCHGGCTKKSLTSNNYCLHSFNNKEMDNVVINRILYNLTFQEINSPEAINV